MEKIRWGIISTGGIATAFAKAINFLDDAELVAVGSRSQASADAFGDEHGIPNRYDSYEALVNDPDVDVVYIGTPHTFHYENMLLALNAGKHVLCEKAFTINTKEAQECINLAREKNLFLMEAMWMYFIPSIVKLRELLAEGIIGDVLMVQAHFNMLLDLDPQSRIMNPELGGGAMLDVGIYPISFARMVLGLPNNIYSHVELSETGVDLQAGLLFAYDDGKSALLSMGVHSHMPNNAIIKGTKGYIEVHPNFWHPTELSIHVAGDAARTLEIGYDSTGLNYEAQEVHKCIRAGKTESDIMPLDLSLRTMKLMDGLRDDWGVTYPNDK